MTERYYSSVAPPTTLSAGITAGSTSIQVGSVTGFPALTPYTLSLNYGSAGEELVQVDAAGGTTLTVERGIDGTSATSHNAGVVVRHVSSARDFSDSRNHENADAGIHGLSPTEELVGTEKVQTLSNKTLDMAEGTLNRIDIFNGPAWTTTVNGDITDTSTDLMRWKQNASAPASNSISNSGTWVQVNTAAVDSTLNHYRFLIRANGGAIDNFYILSGGTIFNRLQNAQDGMVVQESPDAGRRRAFFVRATNGSTIRSSQFTDGTAAYNSSSAAQITMDLTMAAAQTADAIRVRNSALTEVFSVDSDGAINGDSLDVSGTVSSPVYFRSGIQLRAQQTGTSTFTFPADTSVTQAVVFPQAFATAPYVATNIMSGAGSTSYWTSRAINITTTGFDMYVQRGGSNEPAVAWTGIPVQWIATQ